MPAALRYIPPTDAARDAFSVELLVERQVRRKRYLDALKYFEGDHPDQLYYDTSIDQPNDNTVINLVKITAERTASFLFSAVPTFQTDANAVEETLEEAWIKKFLEANGGLPFLIKLALRGFLAGHTFVRVRPPKHHGRGDEKAFPILTLLDPLAITIFWNADDVGEVLWYENRYKVGEVIFIQDYVWTPELGNAGEWVIYTYSTEGSKIDWIGSSDNSPHGQGAMPRTNQIDYVAGSSFKLVPTDLGTDGARHPSPIPPIIEFSHLPHPDDRYGHGEVTQKALQDTINRLWSEINQIVRKHSDPVDVITGADVSDVEQGDAIMVIAQTDAKVQRLEMRGDLTAAVETVERLVKTYLAVARVVLLEGEAKDLQRVTNASVRTLFIDALAKNELLRSSYGSALMRMIRLGLLMSEESFAVSSKTLELTCKWAEPLPVDQLENATINNMLVPLGVRSKRTAATSMGDDWALEQSAIDTEGEADLKKKVEETKQMTAVMPKPVAAGGSSSAKPTLKIAK